MDQKVSNLSYVPAKSIYQPGVQIIQYDQVGEHLMQPLSMFRNFRTRGCPNATKCKKNPCWYAHHERELRKEDDVMSNQVFELAKQAH